MDDEDEPFTQCTPPPRPHFVDSPEPAPNGTAYARAQFFLQNKEVDAPRLRAWFNSLPEASQKNIVECFIQTREYEKTKEICDRAAKNGKVPLVTLIWADRVGAWQT